MKHADRMRIHHNPETKEAADALWRQYCETQDRIDAGAEQESRAAYNRYKRAVEKLVKP